MLTRKSSRLVLINEKEEVFLFLYDFSEFGEDHVGWITPGGGAEAGETEEQTLRREIMEELGIAIPKPLPVVYTQERAMSHPVVGPMLSVETFYVMHCDTQSFDFHSWTPDEKKYVRAYKWWSLAELRTTQENFFTERVADWYEAILKRSSGGCCYSQGVDFTELQMKLEDFDLASCHPYNSAPTCSTFRVTHDDNPAVKADAAPQLSFRYAAPAEWSELLAAVALVDEDWLPFFTQDQRVYIATLANELVGFTILDFTEHCLLSRKNNRFGSVGCVGVIPSARSKGVGLALVAYATQELKAAGCTHASIHYTYLESWYQKLGYQTYLKYRFLPLSFQLSPLFTDNCVLQRDKRIVIFGTGTEGCRLTAGLEPAVVDSCLLNKENSDNGSSLPQGNDTVKKAASALPQSGTATIREGKFVLYLPPLPAGGPYTLTVSDECGDTITLHDTYLGDVWLAGGQSNMEFQLKNADNGAAFIEEIRSFHPVELTTLCDDNPVSKTTSCFVDEPPCKTTQQDSLQTTYQNLFYYHVPHIGFESCDSDEIRRASHWQRCTAKTAGDWSAVAFFFARRIQPELKVPIGILDCNWGGTSASAWMDRETLASDVDTNQYLLDYEHATAGQTEVSYLAELADYNAYAEVWEAKKQECYRVNPEIDWNDVLKLCGPCRWPGPMGPRNEYRPCGLYETMLSKCVPYSLKGFLYYQGESDEHHPDIYYRLFRNMISVWRRDWQDDNLPFLFVQLPMFKNKNDAPSATWATLRAAQEKVFRTVKNTEMAVILDLGKFNDIHPTEKQPVGERLAMLALQQVYGKMQDPQEVTGPMLRDCVPVVLGKCKLKCRFDYAKDGFLIGYRAANFDAFICEAEPDYITGTPIPALDCASKYIHGFEICGADGCWYRATAEAFYEDAEYGFYLSADEVPEPLHARYAWINWAPVTVFGRNGLPLAPFYK